MSYTLTPSPLGGTERLLVSADPRAIKLARSLGARPVRAHQGYFISGRKAPIWNELYHGDVVAVSGSYGWKYKRVGEYGLVPLAVVMKRVRAGRAA